MSKNSLVKAVDMFYKLAQQMEKNISNAVERKLISLGEAFAVKYFNSAPLNEYNKEKGFTDPEYAADHSEEEIYIDWNLTCSSPTECNITADARSGYNLKYSEGWSDKEKQYVAELEKAIDEWFTPLFQKEAPTMKAAIIAITKNGDPANFPFDFKKTTDIK